MTPRRSRIRAITVLGTVSLLAIFAGCRGARRGATSVTPGTTAAVSDSARRSGARADSVRADSMRADSLAVLAKAAAKDSAATRDSSALATARRDSLAAAKSRPAKKAVSSGTSRNCVLDFADSPPETRLLYTRLPDSTANTFIGGGFVGRCQGENNRISADSAEQFESAGIVNMYGNVVYEEPNKLRVTAAHATYFTREGRLFADGGVVATQLASGSTFSGPNIEYYRVMPGRPVAKLVAPNRPTAQLIEKDSTGKPGQPTVVTADRFEDVGDTLVLGWGDVIITREKIIGRSDSLAYNKTTQLARLVRAARIRSLDTAQAFTLNGDTIDLFTTDKKLDRVFALHSATATNKDLVINAERIDLRLKEQKIDEAYAFGKGRARAKTPQQDVEADSMRIVLTDQRPREVRAIGGAVAKGVADTLKIKSADRDMLRGDSLFAYFDTAQVAADTSKQTRIKEIRAFGNASSLFQIASKKGPTAPPALNYVRGQRIFVQFDTGSVRDVRVDSSASGLYLEPAPDSLADSTVRKPPAKKPPLAPVAPLPEPPAPMYAPMSAAVVTISRRPS
ncbi:hypothetical protein [Gemmatimonas groenlandica]|uniref:Organic solvent tolerance-like N-terminal domain-containing protein n=1 Tax=Gemmatimonas groenlandica TaxID=2732249 RepID=A0A6M4IQG7_9BACT|nr:hypothetical protein [Gemmatimonas groenlandica]QJR35082.1 hypothetical protein HKW67_05945 [Gemmatimonas groenlandica]